MGELMKWKKIFNNPDLISFEKKNKGHNIRIEARANNDRSWDIYKTYFDKNESKFTEGYKARNKGEALQLIGSLKNEKDLKKKDIESIKRNKKNIKKFISIRRLYNEINVEKWAVNISNEKNSGILIIRYNDPVEIDLIMHEKHKYFESRIIDEIKNTLGLKSMDEKVVQNIYYFNKHTSSKENSPNSQNKAVIGSISLGFDMD